MVRRLMFTLMLSAVLTQAGMGNAFAQAAAPTAAPRPDEANYLERAIADYREGSFEEALDNLNKARVQEPQSARAAYYLGMTMKKMQAYDTAAVHLKEAVTFQPPVKEAFLELADTYYALGKYDEAMQAIEVCERENIEPAQTVYLKGLVLMKKRSYSEAGVSFEKARTLDPKLETSARYQLAVIAASQGRRQAAQQQFAAVAAADPGSDIGQMAKQQAEALAADKGAGKAFRGSVSAFYEHDSNVMLKPDGATAAQAISGTADNATVLAAELEYAPQFADPYGLRLLYSFYMNAHQELKEFDIQSHTVSVIPSYRIGTGSLALLASYAKTLVDGESYLSVMTLSPLYDFTPTDGQRAQIMVRYQTKDYPQPPAYAEEDRNGTNKAAGLSWSWILAGNRGFLSLAYELDKEDTKGANWSYLGNRVNGSAVYRVTDPFRVSLGIDWYQQAFDDVNTAFLEKRTDATTSITARADYGFTTWLDAQLQYVHMKDSSTIAVYSFTKDVVTAGLVARF